MTASVRARGCIGFAGGGLDAQGHGFAQASTHTLVRWFAAADGFDVDVDLGTSWTLDLGATLVLPLVPTTIALQGAAGQVIAPSDLAHVSGMSNRAGRPILKTPRIPRLDAFIHSRGR